MNTKSTIVMDFPTFVKYTDTNKLIAEFMEVYSEENGYDYTKIGNKGVNYHTSWDWLMPVIRETLTTIELDNLDYDTEELRYNTLDCDIDGAYKEVVEFIKNQNK